MGSVVYPVTGESLLTLSLLTCKGGLLNFYQWKLQDDIFVTAHSWLGARQACADGLCWCIWYHKYFARSNAGMGANLILCKRLSLYVFVYVNVHSVCVWWYMKCGKENARTHWYKVQNIYCDKCSIHNYGWRNVACIKCCGIHQYHCFECVWVYDFLFMWWRFVV